MVWVTWLVVVVLSLVSIIWLATAYHRLRKPLGLIKPAVITSDDTTSKEAGGVQKHEATRDYCLKVVQRLWQLGFSVRANVQYRNQTFTHVAKRTAFEIEKFGFTRTFFILSEFDRLDVVTLRSYSKTCFKYALRRGRIPLPWGLCHNTFCYSVALAYGVDSAVAHAVRNVAPPRHWRAAEILVIYDLATKQLYYLEKTPLWGALYWDHFRNNIVEVLSP